MFSLSRRRHLRGGLMLCSQTSWLRSRKVIRKFIRGTFFQSIISIFIFISCVILYRKYYEEYDQIKILELNGVKSNKVPNHQSILLKNKANAVIPSLSPSYKVEKTNKTKNTKMCPISSFTFTASRPKIKLDSKKYLLPILTNGPNNQIIGLRDSIFLSIVLNRTLILPKFFQHRPGAKDDFYPVPANIRIEVEDLSSLVSMQFISNLEQTCNKKMNVIFLTSRSKYFLDVGYNAKKYEPLTGTINEDYETYLGKIKLPMIPRGIKNMPVAVPGSTVEDIRKVYNSKAKCALYALPFRNLEVRESMESIEKATELLRNSNSVLKLEGLSAEVIYSLGYLATPRPNLISEIGDSFRKKILGGSYIAVHWRYDESDWMLRCGGKEKKRAVDLCYRLPRIKPNDIAEGILMYRDALATYSRNFVENIYFSAPLNLNSLVNKVKGHLNRKASQRRIDLFTFSDMQLHLKRYTSCALIKENLDEIISLVEMDVCFRSTAFLSSDTSSWSMNINRDRHYYPNLVKDAKFDRHIGDVAWEAYLDRTRPK